ncbi:MAG: class I SAM-dependent methyltransferase [Thermoleophilia bacterium]
MHDTRSTSETTPTPAPHGAPPALAGGGRSTSLVAFQRRRWSRRAQSWNDGVAANQGLGATIDAVVNSARAAPGMHVLDMGCGSGQVTIPLARIAADVIAVDVSPAMICLLGENLLREGLGNVSARVEALESLQLPPGSLDLIVSNYALHHLADDDKRRLVAAAAVWLRPGGRLVIGDLMLGRGRDARDRAVIREKVAALARRGPGGWWRVTKNAWRFTARTAERPLPMAAWVRLLEDAGFVTVTAQPIVSEAAVVTGTCPLPCPAPA